MRKRRKEREKTMGKEGIKKRDEKKGRKGRRKRE